ncbi:MAG: energy transducer TonB [Gemmatimonadota bacterium]
MDTAEKTAAAGVPLTIVLAPTDAGRAELAQPQAGLSLPQRKLLSRLDGQRRLADLVGADAGLSSERIARDALRLLMLGLARSDEFVPTQQRAPTTVDLARNTQVPATLSQADASLPSSAAVVEESRRGPMRLAIGGGIAALAIGFGVVLLRPSAVQREAESVASQDQAAAPAPAPLPRPVTAGAVPPDSAPPSAPPAIDRPAEPTQSQSRVAEPRAVRTPPKVEARAPKEEPRAPVARHDAAPPHAVQKPTTVAAVPPVSKPPAKQEAANKSGTERTAPVKETTAPTATPTPPAAQPAERAAAPPPAARVVDSAPATAPQQVAVATPPSGPPAAPVAAATNPPAPAGARALLPSERDFAPSDTDPERLAQQAAGRAPVQRTPPIFPRDAIRQGLTEGSVRARLHIAADGSVQSVETSVTDPRFKVFERPARAALMTWTFVPGAPGRAYDTLVYFRAP